MLTTLASQITRGRGLTIAASLPDAERQIADTDTLLAALNIDLYLYQRHQLGMERERIVGGLRSLLNGLRV